MSPLPAPIVALCSTSSRVRQPEVATWAPLLQRYVDGVVAPWWHLHATIVALPDSTPPFGAWPIYVQDGLDDPGALGYHSDDTGQPTSYVDAGAPNPLFTISHELAEMLADPQGNRLYLAASPDPADGGAPAQILLELCDPCEDESYAVDVGGVKLSDIVTHRYGHGATGPYSASGGLTAPRQVGRNGYISYITGGEWKQITNFDGEGFKVRTLGPAGQAKREGKSLREWVDEHTRKHRATLKESR